MSVNLTYLNIPFNTSLNVCAIFGQPTPPGPSFIERSDMSRETASLLTRIFERIRDTQTTHQGLEELYDFKESHPEINIATAMEDRTRFFQGYIQRGLKSIGQQRERGGEGDGV